MGQKVHPKGFRLGVYTNWDSRWLFENKDVYRDSLIEDIKVREGIMDKFGFARVTRVEIERAINKIVIIIHAVKPGMIIGRGGKGLEDVKKFIEKCIGIKKINDQKIKIEFKIEPVKKPYLNAYFVASEISQKLVRNLPHRLVIHHTVDKVMEMGAMGVKVNVSGRIGGAVISRSEKYNEGKIPVSTLREDIDYASCPALTRSGYVGVKVWIARK